MREQRLRLPEIINPLWLFLSAQTKNLNNKNQMKKKFLLLLAATLASASGWATNLEVGETIVYNDLVFRVISTSENEGDVEVVGFEVPGHEQRLIIPGTLTHGDDTFTVVSIVENAFQGTGLSEISIPVTVKTIGKDAFAGILDNAICDRNSDYEAKRKSNVLDRLTLTVIEDGTFMKWLEMKGKVGGQHKVPKLSNDRAIVESILGIASKQALPE